MPSTATRKPPWTLDEWKAFGQRCQALRDRIELEIKAFPETRGLKASHINALINIYRRLTAAMTKVEDVFESQHPLEGNRTVAIIHGNGGVFWGNCSGGARRGAPILTREQWGVLGAEMKEIRDEAGALVIAIGKTAGVRTRHVDRFCLVCYAETQARSKLDNLVFRQHPGWRDFGHVFYGPTPPSLD